MIFAQIKRYLKIRAIKRKMIRDFYREHGNDLPNYTIDGQILYWKVSVYWDGTYDTKTGLPKDGEYKLSVIQKSDGIMSDDRVYTYNMETRQAEPVPSMRWR